MKNIQSELNSNIIAVVVTYNRKKLLLECLDAIFTQTLCVKKLILVNNCSTDGTEDELKIRGYLNNPIIDYIKTESNIGGAGGFFTGMEQAKKYGYDWIWIMDDDTIPNADCLEKLIEATHLVNENDKISFLASSIYGPNGEYMNVPGINLQKSSNGYTYWYKYLAQGMININIATFVSIIISKDAILKCGLPCKDFFIWGDDTEYTTRLTKYYGDAYMVGKSIAIHKRVITAPIMLKNEYNPDRIDMFQYKYRNAVIIHMYYKSIIYAPLTFILSVFGSLRFIFNPYGFRKIKAIIKGNIEGILQYKRFKQYIDSQIRDY